MPRPAKRHAIIFDLEFTAWEGSQQRGWHRPGERREVVQIGAVKLDAVRLQPVDEFEIKVRPRLNPVLSDYFIGLTGTSNETLAATGVDFITAFRAFVDFACDAPTWSFGRDDLVLAENLRLYCWRGLAVPPHRNVIPWFNAQGIDLKGKNACHVAAAVGTTFEGREHDALADAHGVAKGMTFLIAKGALNPFIGDGA